MKICELKIKDMESVKYITQALLLNGYTTKSFTRFKEFPRETQIDYFAIEIYEHSTGKDCDVIEADETFLERVSKGEEK